MTTEITLRPEVGALMAALSAAEKLTSASPVAPTSLQISNNGFEPAPGTYKRPVGVEMYFHLDVDKVSAFAEAFGTVVESRPRNGQYRLFTYADGVLDGVPFRAWTLTGEQEAAVMA